MKQNTANQPAPVVEWLKSNTALIASVAALAALPFVIAILDGQPLAAVLASEPGNSKFLQGLVIEIFILAMYALSYDLVFGITGLLSFGHAMFFAVGAYLSGILLKSLGWPLLPTLGAVIVAGVAQAVLFSLVLPRVKGITFALVTLGMAEVFHIIIQSREAGNYTGADVGLQGVPAPDFLNPASERLRFYFLAMALTFAAYLVYKRFVDSPTGRVCTAIRENEGRAKMLGYNTFYFKLAALILASITAALAGLLHALYQPIVSPTISNLAFTVNGLLILLIGGVGTLSGALVGAAIFRLLAFYLEKLFGASSSFIIGAVYVTLVLFVPYGIVGTWRLRRLEWKQGWQRWINMLASRS